MTFYRWNVPAVISKILRIRFTAASVQAVIFLFSEPEIAFPDRFPGADRIDRFCVDEHPGPPFTQDVFLLLEYLAAGFRPDIQQLGAGCSIKSWIFSLVKSRNSSVERDWIFSGGIGRPNLILTGLGRINQDPLCLSWNNPDNPIGMTGMPACFAR